VLEHTGDLAGAERVWADGIRIGPDLSPIYLHRGISEMNRGDFAHAGADLANASAKSPHWADTWKAWGDLLTREGRWKQAVAKYDEALKYAPAWTALHVARRAAATHH
jgi:tetratricopeptide (TPR) repeat protein